MSLHLILQQRSITENYYLAKVRCLLHKTQLIRCIITSQPSSVGLFDLSSAASKWPPRHNEIAAQTCTNSALHIL